MGFVRRRTRRRTMLLAGGAAYAAGRAGSSGGGEEGYGEDEPREEVSPVPPSPAPTSGGSETDEIERLAELHADGSLTDEEFAAAKARILGV